MSFLFKGFVSLLLWISLVASHTHDELPKCALTGVHKTRQTILESPNYPDDYPPGTCWDYVIKSPFRCPTKFHIQFLDFFLEKSPGCKNDYLSVGLDNVDEDMDTLCGQVVGIKKYHTPDGVLRLRFHADDSPWSTGKGFKLLITRLACEKEEVLRNLKSNDDDDEEDSDDTVTITAPGTHLSPPQVQLMELFRNISGADQHQVYPLPPLFGLNYPNQLATPLYPTTYGPFYLPTGTFNQQLPQQNNYLATQPTAASEKACKDSKHHTKKQQQQHHIQPYLPPYVVNPYVPVTQDQYIGTWPSTSYLRALDGAGNVLEACCTTPFQQKRFYLSSPGFPRTIFSNLLSINRRDCEFRLQKHSSNICRLRVSFKFFDFGKSSPGLSGVGGTIGLPGITRNTCPDDFIEIDNQRFCGCRSDYVYNGLWNYQGDKKIRMRMGYSGVPSSGFLLEISQESCSESQFVTTTISPTLPISAPVTVGSTNLLGQNFQQQQGNYPGLSQQTFGGLNQQQQQLVQQQQLAQQQQQLLQQQQLAQQQQQLAHLPQQSFNGLSNQFPQNLQQTGGANFGQQLFNPQGLGQSFQQNPLYAPSFIPQHGGNDLGLPQPHPPQFPEGGGFPGYAYSSPNPLQQNQPFGLRYARSFEDQKPVSIVETNSTRKEYYFSENAEKGDRDPLLSIAMSRSSKAEDGALRWESEELRANDNPPQAQVRQKCNFDMGDILRLSVDVLWLTKPTCYAPQRNWFTNFLG
ncbi:uncharacterized protein LOC101888982 [Musca domestica]|uniref:Uncharacterized protein LOC101888982 n=1 Tax=Musca domestica TaxID=7370 RepID=A0A1I8MIM7_MUSDO|nr:uncharacterized protein LOC101888982 [Musca domestica]